LAAHTRAYESTFTRAWPLIRRLFGEVRVVRVVMTAPMVLIAGLVSVDGGGAGRRRDGHYSRHGEKKNCK
jgi:hypothetical protein